MIGAEVTVRPVGRAIVASSVSLESLPWLPEVSSAAVTVRIVTFVEQSSQVSPPPVRTSVAQKGAVEELWLGLLIWPSRIKVEGVCTM